MDRIIVNFISGARTGHTEVYPLSRFTSLYLGRGPQCDVRVDADKDTMVSRSHAVIEWIDPEEGERHYTLTDLLSSNGTYLNGQRVIGTVALSSGDYVRLGLNGPEFLLTVERPAEDEQPSVTQSLRLDKLRLTPPPVAQSAATVRASSIHELAGLEPQTLPPAEGSLRRK
ncbi:MAG: FHA domain-containing protein [Lysobacterales bacterium]